MNTRTIALILAIVFALAGVAGFIPPLVTPPEPGDTLAVGAMHGYLFGLFPVNLLHNLVHLAFAVWGFVAYRTFDGARAFTRATAIIYAVLVVMGLIPGLDTLFGLTPLYGNDIWLHALIAAVAGYAGFILANQEAGATTTGHGHRV